MGNRVTSLRGDGPWRGKATRSVVDRGDRRFTRLVNGYVSSDGHEIRMMPGWKTILDLTEDNNPNNGFFRIVDDFKLPIYQSPVGIYFFPDDSADHRDLLTLKCRSRPQHIHGFTQIQGRIVLWGESGPRLVPILDPSPSELAGGAASPASVGSHRISVQTVTRIQSGGADNKWSLGISVRNLGAPTNRDWSADFTPQLGWHGVRTGDIVWVDGVTVSDATLQTEIDTNLNGRFHRVEATSTIGGRYAITLTTDTDTYNFTPHTTPTAGEVYKTKPARTLVYSPDGLTPYEGDYYRRIDDPDALTVWWVHTGLDTDSPGATCHPSYVANRQRDFGDNRTDDPTEGWNVRGVTDNHPGVSRRRQKALDYRLNPEKAGKRLILAAPGYACLFQVPIVVPSTGAGWPAADTNWSPSGGQGVLYPLNDLLDKPRCLGLPKARLIESLYSTTPNTPNTNFPNQFMLTTQTFSPAPTENWNAGTYRVAISYEDEATGEEGLASEPVTIYIPAPFSTVGSNSREWTFQIVYMHPGYLMPECLALKLNVYIGQGATGPLGYYMSFPLKVDTITTEDDRSAKYGFTGGGSPLATPNNVEIRRSIIVPVPVKTSPISDAIDTTRLAPTANNMPRGAECARYIRGILLSVGHSGTHGNGVLLRTFLTCVFNPDFSPRFWDQSDQIINRALRSPVDHTSTPGGTDNEDGPFGLASNYFPSAYQGAEIWSYDLYPQPRHLDTVDKITNMAANNHGGVIDRQLSVAERLKMVEPPFDPDNMSPLASVSPNATRADLSRGHLESYLVLPRGQIQVGEPGRPDVALSNQIQFLDPNEEDDGLAIGQFNGAAVLCSKHETHTLNWRIAPSGETPRLVSREFGCIATNSMVEFDGGLAWISERGPVALTGEGLQFVGADVEEDFFGSNRRYLKDSKGLMRHCWGAHDKSRGLVLWGLVSTDATHTISYRNQTTTFSNADDRGKSRFPCDEILVWSYRANAWSTWRMPSGLEVLWVDEIIDANGDQQMAFLAADNRIYVWDDAYQDTNTRPITHVFPTKGSGSTINMLSSITIGADGIGAASLLARGSADTFLRAGMLAVQTDTNGNYKDQTTISSVSASTSPQTVTLAKSITWDINDVLSFGHRPEMEIQGGYVGEGITNMDLEALHMRYWMPWEGNSNAFAWVRADVQKSDELDVVGSPISVGMSQDPEYSLLGAPAAGQKLARRKSLTQGRPVGPELAVHLRILGQCQVRISDILMEIA